jgi:hypothetical protein
MHFGATVRDIISTSCGTDVRMASARTPLPEPRSPDTLRLLAANLRLAFGVAIPDSDLAHVETIGDVLRCVRVRRWAWRVAQTEAALSETAIAARTAPASVTDPVAPSTPEGACAPEATRQRLIRYTRRDGASSTPTLSVPPSGAAIKRL